ncbi:hypothetical protein ON010_g2898 [Phytophthora cinnamomi]|nr:hypothetical protein ON010_g2898 [Phytophthora cinnamomi]
MQTTNFELASREMDDDGDSDDIDVNGFESGMLIITKSLKLNQGAGALSTAHTMVQAKHTKMTRSSFRETAKAMKARFADLGEPGTRLACMPAQLHALQPLMKAPKRYHGPVKKDDTALDADMASPNTILRTATATPAEATSL